MNDSLLQKLVEVYSPSGQENEVARLLVDEMSARGFATRLDEVGNAVGVAGHGPIGVYLVGHIDTVPGKITVQVKEGKLYGRGAVDAKGPLATFIEAASAFVDSEKMTLTVIGCVQEEASSKGAQHLLETHGPATFVIIGEPSGWDAVTLGYKGSASLNYALECARAHQGSAEPTAAEEAVIFYNGLCEQYPDRGPGFTEVSLNLVTINSESHGNYEAVNMYVNVRMPPEFDFEQLQARVEAQKGKAKVSWTPLTPAVLAGKQNPLVRAFLSGIRAQNGRPRFKRKTGTSDMNLLNAWNCPILAYGPGDSKLDHRPDEHIDLAEYQTAIEVLKNTLAHLELNLP